MKASYIFIAALYFMLFCHSAEIGQLKRITAGLKAIFPAGIPGQTVTLVYTTNGKWEMVK